MPGRRMAGSGFVAFPIDREMIPGLGLTVGKLVLAGLIGG